MARKDRATPVVGSTEPGVLPSYLSPTADGYELRVKVVPGASNTEIVGPYGDRLKIRVAAPPERGKANIAVVQLLKKIPNVREVQIIAGESSPEKVFRLMCDGPWTL